MLEQTGSSVLELRRRLYRPDPPEDAVAAYLAALEPADPPVRTPAPVEPRRHAVAVAGGAVGLMAVAAAGLGIAWQASAAPAPAPAPAPVAVSQLAAPSVPGYPIGELVGGPATTGMFDARGVHVVVSVLCSGDGTITLRLGPDSPTVLTCQAGGPALAMLTSSEDLDRFTLSVTPQPHLQWSLAVGALAVPTR